MAMFSFDVFSNTFLQLCVLHFNNFGNTFREWKVTFLAQTPTPRKDVDMTTAIVKGWNNA